MKPLEKIKYGEKVVSVLVRPLFFQDIQNATSLDPKTLQTTLARLQRNGYIEKDERGLWSPVLQER